VAVNTCRASPRKKSPSGEQRCQAGPGLSLRHPRCVGLSMGDIATLSDIGARTSWKPAGWLTRGGNYLGRALSQNPCDVFGNGNRDDGNCDGNSYLFYDDHTEKGPRSCTTSRLRCSLLSPNVRTAAASAASRLAASTTPRTWARLRISDTRQLRLSDAAVFLSGDFRARRRNDMVAKIEALPKRVESVRLWVPVPSEIKKRGRKPLPRN
jgi:hypothetical protein